MTNPRKRKAKSVKAKPTKQTQPEPQPGPSQTDDSVCQAESDPPPPELQAEGEVQPNEEEDSLEVDEGSGRATKKKKLLTALTPEQEEEMVEWLSGLDLQPYKSMVHNSQLKHGHWNYTIHTLRRWVFNCCFSVFIVNFIQKSSKSATAAQLPRLGRSNIATTSPIA